MAATDPDGGLFRCDLPAPTGPHPVGTVDLHLVDTRRSDPWAEDDSRPRELMITVWYPARRNAEAPATPYATPGLGPAFDTFAGSLGIPAGSVDWTGIGTHTTVGAPVAHAARRLPVVLYTPGRLNPRFLDTTVAAELASHGYAVVAVDHTYESLAVEFPGGRVITPAPALAGELSPQVMKAAVDCRVADLRFVLNQLRLLARGGNPDADGRTLPAGLGAALDIGSVGVFGHSLGGTAAAEAMRLDRGISAGAVLEGPLGYGPDDPELFAPVTRTGLRQPFLLAGSSYTPELPFTHTHVAAWQALWKNSPGWKRDLWTARARHQSYCDFQILVPALAARFGTPPPAVVAAMVGDIDPVSGTDARRAYLTAFFDRTLKHRRRPLLDNPTPHLPDVTRID
ncbi:lipase [Streptomyces sp. NBC_00568]|uniref:alpha/beta hydrolase family protein n=1 Tax=unclassified Streptomyces TaxID=2593676 RepID=UPI002257F10D|nr:lipase [Streptomyces sp. NBC_00568]MCX4991219.1 lipase [Streptomyces sp. NBC_00568]